MIYHNKLYDHTLYNTLLLAHISVGCHFGKMAQNKTMNMKSFEILFRATLLSGDLYV